MARGGCQLHGVGSGDPKLQAPGPRVDFPIDPDLENLVILKGPGLVTTQFYIFLWLLTVNDHFLYFEKSVFSTKTQPRFALDGLNGVLGPQPIARHSLRCL